MTRVLRAHGVGKLPKSAPKRTLHSKRYVKTVTGQHVQVDVKFLSLRDQSGEAVKRYQYTAIDDSTYCRRILTQLNSGESLFDHVADYFCTPLTLQPLPQNVPIIRSIS